MKIYQTIKKGLHNATLSCIIWLGGSFPLLAQPHNGTEQLPNRGFEIYDNEGSDNIEPWGWNSFMSAKTAGGLVDMGKAKRLDKMNGGRPGSKGNFFLKVYSNAVLGVVANGNVTTGRINMGSTTPTDASNHNFSDLASEGFFWRQTTVPDSLVVWIWFRPQNSSDECQINLLIHNENWTRDPGTNRSEVVAQAKINTAATDGWQRISVPFVRTGATNDARYVLASITTNKTPGGGQGGDEIYIDDMFFVYNPTLSIKNISLSSIGLRDDQSVIIEVPFVIKGTMSPQMGDDNRVIAEISDENGSFDRPTKIGELITDESGSITASLPPTLPVGTKYRIRVRSTNYPRISEDNGKDIELYRGYYIGAVAKPGHKGTISGCQTYKQGATATLTAIATPGNHFTHWSENGQVIENAGDSYSFVVDRNRNLTAHFDTNYYSFSCQVEGQGKVSFSPTAGENGLWIHNTPIRLQATPDVGSKFVGYFYGSTKIDNRSDYTFPLVRDMDLTARFELQQFNIVVESNNAALGRVEGSGSYKFNAKASLKATPEAYCRFVAWLNADGDTLGKDNPFEYTVTAAGRITGLFAETFYRVHTAVQPLGSATISGGGSFSAQNQQHKIELTAEPKPGYLFSHWEVVRGNEPTSETNTDNPLSLVSGPITTDYTCTAVMRPIVYQILADVEPEQGGTVSGAGEYSYQTQALLTATPNRGYKFKAWMNVATGETISTQAVLSFQAVEDRQLLALFERERYDITVKSQPESYGTVNGGGNYAFEDEVVLSATPAEGNEFLYWYGESSSDTVSHKAEFSLSVLGKKNYTAVFSRQRRKAEVEIIPEQGGRVVGTGLYEPDHTATLTATPNVGYTFKCWRTTDGQIIESNGHVLELVMNQSHKVQAVFEPRRYTITLAVAGNRNIGEVSFNNETYKPTLSASLPYDSTILFYARATDPNYKVTNWLKQGISLGRTEQISYTVKGDARVEADFGTQVATISVNIEPQGAGEVSGAGNHSKGYIELTAQAATGYHFATWKNADGETLGENVKHTVLLESDMTLTATFEKNLYTLRVGSSLPQGGAGRAEILPASGEASPDGALSIRHGETFSLSAQPAPGYKFAGWQIMGESALFSTQAVYEGIATQNATYQAVFTPLLYSLSTSAIVSYKGSTRGDGRYDYGTQATITARPSVGNHFVSWQLYTESLTDPNSGESQTSKENPCTFTIAGNTTAQAVFDTNRYTLRFKNQTPKLGSITLTLDETTYQNPETVVEMVHRQQIVLTAEPISNYYRFAYFADEAGRKISKSSPFTLTIVSDTSLYAVFEPITFQLSAESANPAMGRVTSGGAEQPYLGKVTLTAQPAFGYEFEKWVLTKDPQVVFSTAISVQFTMTQDTAVLAIFKPKKFFVSGEAAIDGSGSVQGGNRLYTFDEEAVVEAIPAYGYAFSHWEINNIPMSEEPVYTWRVSETTKAVAVFTPVQFRINLALSPESDLGYTIGDGIYSYGDIAIITAIPNTDYYFEHWNNGRHVISRENPYSLVVGCDSTFTATLYTDTLTINLQTVSEGSVQGGGRFLKHENVTLTAVPDLGYDFLAWNNADGERVSTDNPFVFPATESVTYTAVFFPKAYTISLNTESGGSLVGGGEYPYQSDVVLLAKADSVHTFRCWQLDETSSEDSLLSALFTPEVLKQPRLTYRVNRPLGLMAIFDPFAYNIVATASPANSGTFRGTGTFNHGSSTVLEAVPAEHFDFVAWTLNGEIVSDSAVLEIPYIDGPRFYTALFKPSEYIIELEVYPGKGGVASGAGSYHFGDTVQISVSPISGYVFQKWLDKDFKVVSTEPTFTHIVVGSNIFSASVKADNEDLNKRRGLKIYPNPAVEDLHFEAEEEMTRVVLLDAQGRVLRTQAVFGTQAVLPTAAYPCGIYFFRIEWRDGKISHGKWVR